MTLAVEGKRVYKSPEAAREATTRVNNLFTRVDGFLRTNALTLRNQLLVRRDQSPTDDERRAAIERMITRGGTVTFVDRDGANWKLHIGYTEEQEPGRKSKTVEVSRVELAGDGSNQYDTETMTARFGANIAGTIDDNKTYIQYDHYLQERTEHVPGDNNGWGKIDEVETLVDDLVTTPLA